MSLRPSQFSLAVLVSALNHHVVRHGVSSWLPLLQHPRLVDALPEGMRSEASRPGLIFIRSVSCISLAFPIPSVLLSLPGAGRTCGFPDAGRAAAARPKLVPRTHDNKEQISLLFPLLHLVV